MKSRKGMCLRCRYRQKKEGELAWCAHHNSHCCRVARNCTGPLSIQRIVIAKSPESTTASPIRITHLIKAKP